jgi:hypothetical protein
MAKAPRKDLFKTLVEALLSSGVFPFLAARPLHVFLPWISTLARINANLYFFETVG